MVHNTGKERQKKAVIDLRKTGLTYSEILKTIPVAKSTPSLWLRSVGLAKEQLQKITNKGLEAVKRGGKSRKDGRIAISIKIKDEAASQIGTISGRELWLMGIMLYWAEGSKEKEDRPGIGVQFSNSDPRMIKVFLRWLSYCGIRKENIYFDIFIHENSKNDVSRVIDFWSKETSFPPHYFPHVYFKKHAVRTIRKNIGDTYYGLLKVRVRASSKLNRKIAGWINGVVNYFK